MPDKISRDRAATLRMLRADGAVVDGDAVAEIVAILTADLASGCDNEPEVYREHVHDVIGALLGRGIDPTDLLRAMRRR